MRILQVSSARTLGGGEMHVIDLIMALRQRGHDVRLAARRDGPFNPDLPLSLLRLRSILKRERFDVVHAHVARDYPIVAAAALGIRESKVICTRHLLYPVRHNPLYKRVNGWIAPTNQILKSLAPLKPKTSAVIPNWVDLEKFPYRPHTFHQPVKIGLIGQVAPHKGHDDAIEAMRVLGPGFNLLIAGQGERNYVKKLRHEAAGLPVWFTGFVPLPKFFEDVDIVIVPSWNEPFGLISLEAMASGIPIVATGPLEVIRGTLIPPHDPAALAQAIRTLHPDTPTAREHVEKNFDMRIIIPRIENFYSRQLREFRQLIRVISVICG